MKRLDQYSQHFLRSPRLVAELIGHSNLRKNDIVIDIGAGSGVISAVLARRVRQVVAIEADPRMVQKLRQNFSAADNVLVIQKDFLRYQLPSEKYKVFANPPFHLSSAIIQKLISAPLPPAAIYLILQKQFAKKLIIDQGNFTSQLGACLAPWWQTRIRRPLKRSDFAPPPNVDTVLLEIKPRIEPLLPNEARAEFNFFTEKCFAEQRFFGQIKQQSQQFNPEKKPSELTTEEWVRLFRFYQSKMIK